MQSSKTWVVLLAVSLLGATPAPVPSADERAPAWTSTFPFGGTILSSGLALDPGNPEVLYAAAQWVGLFRSGDGAAHWEGVAPDRGLTSIAVVPGGETLYGIGSLGGAAALLVSEDRGESWTSLSSGLPGAVQTLAPDPGRPDTLYAGTAEGGLFHSTDKGASWQRIDAGLPDSPIRRIVVDPHAAQELWVGVEGRGLFQSRDGGAIWERRDRGVAMLAVHDVLIHPADSRVLYVSEGDPLRILKSTDGGASWNELAVAPDGSTHDGYRSGYRSTDSGASWERMSYPERGLSDLATHRGAPGVVYGIENNLFRSRDRGVTWEDATGGYFCCFPGGSVTIDPSDPQTLYVTTFVGDYEPGGVYKSADAGLTWGRIDSGPLREATIGTLTVDPNDPDVLYAGSIGHLSALYLNDDRFEVRVAWEKPDGTHGVGKPAQLTDDTGYFYFFAEDNVELVIKVLDACGASDRFWVFAAGLTNVQIEMTVTDTATGQRRVYANPQGTAFQPILDTGTFTGCAQTGAGPRSIVQGYRLGAFKSTDGGRRWRQLGGGLPAYFESRQITVHPLDSNVVYIGTLPSHNSGIYKSTDAGATWTHVFAGGKGALAVDPRDPDVVYVDGIHRSTDGGRTWETFAAGLTRGLSINEVHLDPANLDRVLISTWGGVYEMDFSQVGAGRATTRRKPVLGKQVTPELDFNGRFRVRATWRSRNGGSGAGLGVPITDDTGYFYFFDEDNVEVVVKVLDGCGRNDRFWLFAAGLTDVETVLAVEDLESGETRTYRNPLGTAFQPIQDVQAFATCP